MSLMMKKKLYTHTGYAGLFFSRCCLLEFRVKNWFWFQTEFMHATIFRLIYNTHRDDELKLAIRSHFKLCIIRNNVLCYSYSIHKIAIMSSMCVHVCVVCVSPVFCVFCFFFISFIWFYLIGATFSLSFISILIAQKCTFTVHSQLLLNE